MVTHLSSAIIAQQVDDLAAKYDNAEIDFITFIREFRKIKAAYSFWKQPRTFAVMSSLAFIFIFAVILLADDNDNFSIVSSSPISVAVLDKKSGDIRVCTLKGGSFSEATLNCTKNTNESH